MAKYKMVNGGVYDSELDLHIPENAGNRHWQEYQVWLDDPANTPDPADPVVITAEMIKGEAGRRILAKYPEWKQANMTARMVELNKIRAEAGSWTTAEQTEVDAIQAAWDWVKSARAASDALELTLPADYNDNSHWPVS